MTMDDDVENHDESYNENFNGDGNDDEEFKVSPKEFRGDSGEEYLTEDHNIRSTNETLQKYVKEEFSTMN